MTLRSDPDSSPAQASHGASVISTGAENAEVSPLTVAVTVM